MFDEYLKELEKTAAKEQEKIAESKPASCPGSKILSKGKGLGKGRGAGKGPLGVPIYEKTAAADMPPFLEQDRPKKVKSIYSALKREHPDMPAEMKARIAARQGKRGKQHQGPPYKAPLTKAAQYDPETEASLLEMQNRAEAAPMRGAQFGAMAGGALGTAAGLGLGHLAGKYRSLGPSMQKLVTMLGGAGGYGAGVAAGVPVGANLGFHRAEEKNQLALQELLNRNAQQELQSPYQAPEPMYAEQPGYSPEKTAAVAGSLLRSPMFLGPVLGTAAGGAIGAASVNPEETSRLRGGAVGAVAGLGVGSLLGAVARGGTVLNEVEAVMKDMNNRDAALRSGEAAIKRQEQYTKAMEEVIKNLERMRAEAPELYKKVTEF
jgi:hypothetical protein